MTIMQQRDIPRLEDRRNMKTKSYLEEQRIELVKSCKEQRIVLSQTTIKRGETS